MWEKTSYFSIISNKPSSTDRIYLCIRWSHIYVPFIGQFHGQKYFFRPPSENFRAPFSTATAWDVWTVSSATYEVEQPRQAFFVLGNSCNSFPLITHQFSVTLNSMAALLLLYSFGYCTTMSLNWVFFTKMSLNTPDWQSLNIASLPADLCIIRIRKNGHISRTKTSPYTQIYGNSLLYLAASL